MSWQRACILSWYYFYHFRYTCYIYVPQFFNPYFFLISAHFSLKTISFQCRYLFLIFMLNLTCFVPFGIIYCVIRSRISSVIHFLLEFLLLLLSLVLLLRCSKALYLFLIVNAYVILQMESLWILSYLPITLSVFIFGNFTPMTGRWLVGICWSLCTLYLLLHVFCWTFPSSKAFWVYFKPSADFYLTICNSTMNSYFTAFVMWTKFISTNHVSMFFHFYFCI